MKGAQKKVIRLEEYSRLKQLVETSGPGKNRRSQPGTVHEFSQYRARALAEAAAFTQSQRQSGALLKVLQALCKDYEVQMLTIAHQRTRREWLEEFKTDPYHQIEYDVQRLNRFMEALEFAVQEKGSKTLNEAVNALESWASEEVLATREYIFNSEYVGFAAMRNLIESTSKQELCETYKNLTENNFLHGLAPLSEICWEGAAVV